MKDEYAEAYDVIADHLFEDPHSDVEQAALLKVVLSLTRVLLPVTSLSLFSPAYQLEGVWTDAQFRNAKVYRLVNKTQDTHDSVVVRVRSIPRKLANQLEPRHFTQTPALNAATLSGVCMRPTMGNEIVMLREGRSLPRPMNMRRHMTVCLKSSYGSIYMYPSPFFPGPLSQHHL